MKNQTLSNDKIDKLIKDQYTAGFMRNVKWVKLIQLLIDNYKLIKSCNVKLIYDDTIRHMNLTGDEQYQVDFYSDSMENMVTNPIVQGWTLYKEIEWIEFPIDSENNRGIQEIIRTVNSSGKFNDELTDEYYRIYAYK